MGLRPEQPAGAAQHAHTRVATPPPDQGFAAAVAAQPVAAQTGDAHEDAGEEARGDRLDRRAPARRLSSPASTPMHRLTPDGRRMSPESPPRPAASSAAVRRGSDVAEAPEAQEEAAELGRVRDWLGSVSRGLAAETLAPDAEALARLASDLPRLERIDATTGSSDLEAKLTEEQLLAFAEAVGIPRADLASTGGKAAGERWSGALNTLGPLPATLFNYIAAPASALAAKSSWLNFGLGLGTQAVSPFLNALLQSMVVTACEHVRERSGVTVVQDPSINDKKWPSHLAGGVSVDAQLVSDNGKALRTLVMPAGDGAEATLERMTAVIGAMSGSDRVHALAAFNILAGSIDAADAGMEQLAKARTSQRKQFLGNFWQSGPRMLRGFASSLPGLGRGGETPEEIGLVGRREHATGEQVLGAQAGLTGVLTVAHMSMAALDEATKQDFTLRSNITKGDWITPAGKAKLRRGERLDAQDIDAARAASYFVGPMHSLVKRVTAALERMVADERAAAAADPGARTAEEAEAAPESLRADRISSLERQIALVRSGDLDRLDPGSAAARLLYSGKDPFSRLLWGDMIAKVAKPGEFAAQSAQRVGTLLHYVVLGSGAAAVGGKLAGALLGGAEHVPTRILLGVAFGSLITAAIGALTQSIAINIKNYKRTSDDPLTWLQQVWWGTTGAQRFATNIISASSAEGKYIGAMAEVDDIMQHRDALRRLLA